MDFCPQPKGRTRKQIKGRQQRQAAKVVKSVRAQCVDRDGPLCRVIATVSGARDVLGAGWPFGVCTGHGEWAHMHHKRRSQTRNQAPEIRHTSKDSLMLCTLHHAQYDNKAKPRLFITALTRRGADGPLKFRRAK